MPACLPQRLGGVAAGLRVDLVAARVRQRFGAQRGGVDPCHRMAVGDSLVGDVLVADHHRTGAVGRRTGLVEADGVPQHLRCHHLLQRDVGLMQVRQRVLGAVAPVLHRDHGTDVHRRARSADVGAHVRSEVAARACADRFGERHRNAQRPHGIRLGLLLPRHRQHAPVLSRLHQAGRHHTGRPADRTRGVHPDQRLAGRTHGVGHEQLRHHDALEEVGRLADHDRVDVIHGRPGVGQRLVDGLANQAVHRDVLALGDVLRLAGAEHRSELDRHDYFPSSTATRFCCNTGPPVACASTRPAEPIENMLCRKADALQPGGEHRVGRQRAARRVDLRRRRADRWPRSGSAADG